MKADKKTIITLDKEFRMLQDEAMSFVDEYRIAFISLCESHEFKSDQKKVLKGIVEMAFNYKMRQFIEKVDERILMNGLLNEVDDIINPEQKI